MFARALLAFLVLPGVVAFAVPVAWLSSTGHTTLVQPLGLLPLAGVQQATIVGLVFGMLFAMTGRIWTVMFAHAAFDLTALALIYWNLESAVAHAIFE